MVIGKTKYPWLLIQKAHRLVLELLDYLVIVECFLGTYIKVSKNRLRGELASIDLVDIVNSSRRR